MANTKPNETQKTNKKKKSKLGAFALVALCLMLGIFLSVGATIAWFAGSDTANSTMFLGGPVNVVLTNSEGTITSGDNTLTTTIARSALLPGMAIDFQALAKVTSTDANPTPALLRAKVTCVVQNDTAGVVNNALNDEIVRVITMRTNSTDGWLKNGDYYYWCSAGTGEAGNAVMADIATSSAGTSITFINDRIILPGKEITNASADSEVTFTVLFEAVQAFLPDSTGVDQAHTITNADKVFTEAFEG